MRTTASLCLVLLAIGLMVVATGCPGPRDEPEGPENGQPPGASAGENGGPDEAPANGDGHAEPPAESAPEQPPVELSIPEVRLPQMLAETCLVGVGDQMPEAALDVLGGEQTPLRSQLGRRLTVILFWTSDNLYAQDELHDLTGDVAEPYAEQGVRVIGINVGDTPEEAAATVAEAEAAFPNFLDPNGEYFAKVATEKLPRTYLLGPDGTILWFDLEYSSTTRRQLRRAIEAALESEELQPPAAAEGPEAEPESGEGPKPAESETAADEDDVSAPKDRVEKTEDGEEPAVEGPAAEEPPAEEAEAEQSANGGDAEEGDTAKPKDEEPK